MYSFAQQVHDGENDHSIVFRGAIFIDDNVHHDPKNGSGRIVKQQLAVITNEIKSTHIQ